MKIKSLAIAVVTTFGLVNAASAAEGVINFTGSISAAACSVNNVAGSASTSGTVDFGTVSANTLAGTGDSTVSTPFSIELTDCAVSAAPQITFNGTPVATAGYTELFTTDVSGVGIRIEDAGRTGTYYSSGVSASNAGFDALVSEAVPSATGNFNAYLVSYDATTKEGSVDTSVIFTIDYS